MRNKVLIGNWKLHHHRASAQQFIEELLPKMCLEGSVDVAIAPVAPMLDFVGRLLENGKLALAAQNVFYEEKGAFTGEWAPAHLTELNVKFCIIGHSERRKFFFETDEDVSRKTFACLRYGLIPVVCVGESESEREQGKTPAIIKKQVLAVLANLNKENFTDVIFAYEPVWAIGTGKTATSKSAQEVHLLIRELVSETLGYDAAFATRIIYGGSVTAGNIKEMCSMPDIDGALVGGASLQAASFLSMVEALHEK